MRDQVLAVSVVKLDKTRRRRVSDIVGTVLDRIKIRCVDISSVLGLWRRDVVVLDRVAVTIRLLLDTPFSCLAFRLSHDAAIKSCSILNLPSHIVGDQKATIFTNHLT